MRLSSYPARPCLPAIKVVVLSSTPHFDLSRLSRYSARQASQAKPSPRPCLSAYPFVWPPSLRQAYCVSFSVCVVVVAYASWATHKISTHFSSPLAFRIHISLAAFCFAVCGYRLAVRRGRQGQEQRLEQRRQANHHRSEPQSQSLFPLCPCLVPVPGHVRALLWLLCLALVLAVPLCVCLRTTTCSPWTLEETSWCVRLARSSFNFAFSKPNAFNCLSPEQGCSSSGGWGGSPETTP